MRILIMLAVLMLAALGVMAQEGAPTVSDVDRLKLQTFAQRREIAQLKAQLAQAEFDRATEAANALLHSLQKPGYALDVERLVYVPTPAPEKKAGQSK